DEYENPAHFAARASPRHGILQHEMVGAPLRALELEHALVPDHLDLGVREHALLEDLRSTEPVAAVHHEHFARVAREIVRLFDGGVAAAHDREHLALEERAIAHRAIRDALARVLQLARNAQLHRRATGGEDHGGSAMGAAVRGDDVEPGVVGLADLQHGVGDDHGAALLRVVGQPLRPAPPSASLDAG